MNYGNNCNGWMGWTGPLACLSPFPVGNGKGQTGGCYSTAYVSSIQCLFIQ